MLSKFLKYILYKGKKEDVENKGNFTSDTEISLLKLERYKEEIITDVHYIPLKNLVIRLQTDLINGLKSEYANQILEKTGPNELTPPRNTSEISKFLRTLFHGMSLLLWIGAALCLLAAILKYEKENILDSNNIVLGVALIIIILITSFFMYFQERRSYRIMDSFNELIPLTATIIRDGIKQTLLSSKIVLGDIVEIKSGDKIPADIRIIECQGFKVDNSAITGESVHISLTTESTSKQYHKTKNMAFFSTNAVEGVAKGVVVRCGDETVIGRIAGLTSRLKPNRTPISKELDKFMHAILIWACIIGIFFGIASIIVGYSWLDAYMFLIGIIVANVPEGLLATITVGLSLTAKKMASKKCLVKNLETVETLGSISVICSDKTGTLTQNKMTVCHLWINNSTFIADHSVEQYEARKYKDNLVYKTLMRCATLCSRAEFLPDQDDVPTRERIIRGDASEAAILKFLQISFTDSKKFREKYPKIIEQPFESRLKYQLSVHKMENNLCLLVMKGAPEKLLENCSTILLHNKVFELSETLKKCCEDACENLAQNGERVLGFSDLVLPDKFTPDYPFSLNPKPNFPISNLRFLGFMSLFDPPRPEVYDAVRNCKLAGITVVMITGDHPITAKSIAHKVGIISNISSTDMNINEKTPLLNKNKAIIVHGSELQNLTTDELDNILLNYQEIVFARTSPMQKLQIVEGYQRLGRIVAVTGDGVNDAPALKKADIGIAMGISGTQISQQSADMVLLNDNFASIITGIEEGRKIFDNLKKSIAYIMSSNVAEVTPYLGFVLLKIPLPIGIIAVLSIDVLTDMLPAISLACEKAERNIMIRPPRNPKKDILVTQKLFFYTYGHIGLIESAAGYFVYFVVMAEYGFMPKKLLGLRTQWENSKINNLKDSFNQEWTYEERKILENVCSTAVMIAIIVTQIANAIVCKTRYNSIIQQGMDNWFLNFSIVVEILITCALCYLPYMKYLKFYPVKITWWCYAIPFAAFIIIFDEWRKWNIRRNPDAPYFKDLYY